MHNVLRGEPVNIDMTGITILPILQLKSAESIHVLPKNIDRMPIEKLNHWNIVLPAKTLAFSLAINRTDSSVKHKLTGRMK